MKVFALFGRPQFVARFHAVAAILWLAVGVFGLVQYLVYLKHNPDPKAFTPIAQSIPVLFFISVYANVVGHWSSYQAAKVEVKQDEAISDVKGSK